MLMKITHFSLLRSRPHAGGAPWPRRVLLVGLCLGLGLLYSPSAGAQPDSGGPLPGTSSPTAVPLDGGASLLLAGGVGYALRRLRRRRK